MRTFHSSERPLIIAGQGTFYADACQELLSFAELAKAPVLTTLNAKSCFPEDHPLFICVRGDPAEYFIKRSNLVLAIGCGLSPSLFSQGISSASAKKIIHYVVEESNINRIYPTEHAVVGDTKLVLWQLIVELDRRGALKRKDITNEIEAVKRTKAEKYDSLMESGEPPVNPYRVYAEIMASLDRKNRFVTHESGNTRDQLSTVYEAIIPYGFMGWGNVSTLGFSLGVAMGAKLAMPGREIVSVNGDAGFSYQVGNYEAVVSSRLGITTGHINNSGYSPVFWGNGHSPYTSEVTPFDIVNTSRVVEGLGIHSERIEDPDEVAPALGSALK